MKMCLYSGCQNGRSGGRGLCSNHYLKVSYLVKSGRTTWKELEESGQSLPVKVIKPKQSPIQKTIREITAALDVLKDLVEP